MASRTEIYTSESVNEPGVKVLPHYGNSTTRLFAVFFDLVTNSFQSSRGLDLRIGRPNTSRQNIPKAVFFVIERHVINTLQRRVPR